MATIDVSPMIRLIRKPLFILLSIFLAACSTAPQKATTPTQQPVRTTETTTPDSFIRKAQKSSSPEREALLLQAISMLLDQGETTRTRIILSLIDENNLTRKASTDYALAKAALAINANQGTLARQWLTDIRQPLPDNNQNIQLNLMMAQALELEGEYNQAISYWGNSLRFMKPPQRTTIFPPLWQSLLNIETDTLINISQNNSNRELQPWVELAIIYRTPTQIDTQLTDIQSWQKRWQYNTASNNLPQTIINLQNTPAYHPGKIALLLPLSGPLSKAGTAVRNGFMTAYYSSITDHQNSPELQIYDTNGKNAAELAYQAENEGADLIVGPLGRDAAELSILERKVSVPQLILNQTTLTSGISDKTYEFGLSSENEARLAAIRAYSDGHRNALTITPDSDWGRRVANSFKDEWQKLGGDILQQKAYTGKGDYNTAASALLLIDESNQRAKNLRRIIGINFDHTPRRRQDADMIFIAASPAQGRQLKPSLDFYFAYNMPIYTTSNIYSGTPDSDKDRDLNDVRFPLMPWITNSNDRQKSEIVRNWPESNQLAPLYALGIDAWRLFPRLEQLSRSPGAQMFGSTGIISIDEQGEVTRTLDWQYFRNGKPVPLSKERSARQPDNFHVLDDENNEPERTAG